MSGWVTRFEAAHPGTLWVVGGTAAVAESDDGTHVSVAVPFAPLSEASLPGLFAHLQLPWQVGIVLVRKGGFGVVHLCGAEVVESKIGRRHVQGRTKAGGWSQHRFARRRDNQAQAAFDATADHVQRILTGTRRPLQTLATGGDRQAVTSVFAHPALVGLTRLPQVWLGGLPDPSRVVVDGAVAKVRSVEVTITGQPQI